MLKDIADMFVWFIGTTKENISFELFIFYFFCFILSDVNFVHIAKEELIRS